MSVSVALQDLIIATLKASPAVMALVADRIWDEPPANPEFPYISMGPDSFSTADADCIDMREQTVQIDCWTRANGRKWPCKQIVDAVVGALRHLDGDLSDGALVDSEIRIARVLDDQDGITAHGVVQLIVIIEG
ncbi:DUF3168 domain-containing protein [Brucella intermedia]|uniref:DUF3168 domain-containing protein n=1 Tax=Brucella intermedia TaxID=94625 RepID=UPI00235DC45D|nr:DUF3168 domain-containing protein [Brucella intermedia]